jgi:hypothetical protein
MVSEHTLIPGKGERGQRVPHTAGGYGAGRQSVRFLMAADERATEQLTW